MRVPGSLGARQSLRRQQGARRVIGVALLRSLGVAAVVLGAMATPRPAAAYVRYLSESGCPYGWATRSLTLRGFPAGMPDLDEDQIADAFTQAAYVWGPENATCTDMAIQIQMMSPADVPPGAVFDKKNNIVFRDPWCPDDADPRCFDSRALAITSVFARTWGEIVDADIEVNTSGFTWGDLVSMPGTGGRQDLQNAITHEIGHVLGLDHTCYDNNPRGRPLDQNHEPIPDCSRLDLPESVLNSTMYVSADPGDTTKRSLEPDDLQAVCDTYPRGRPDPLVCASRRDSSGGCSVAPAARAGGFITGRGFWMAMVAGLLAALWASGLGPRASRRQRRDCG